MSITSFLCLYCQLSWMILKNHSGQKYPTYNSSAVNATMVQQEAVTSLAGLGAQNWQGPLIKPQKPQQFYNFEYSKWLFLDCCDECMFLFIRVRPVCVTQPCYEDPSDLRIQVTNVVIKASLSYRLFPQFASY